MSIQDLETLYLSDLNQARADVRVLIKAFADLAPAANDAELADAFRAHVAELSLQLDRLAKIDGTDRSVSFVDDDVMPALVAKARRTIANHARGPIRDAALIAAVQHIQHYLIATYGTLAASAKLLGRHDEKRVLGAILEEERAVDEDLTVIAMEILDPRTAVAA